MKLEKEIVNQIEKHRKKMRKVFKAVKLIERSEDFQKLLELAHAYYTDSKYFMMNGKILQAFEALMISWTYIDTGLRLRIFEIPEEFQDYFTA